MIHSEKPLAYHQLYQEQLAQCAEILHLAHQIHLQDQADILLYGQAIREKSPQDILLILRQQNQPEQLQEQLDLLLSEVEKQYRFGSISPDLNPRNPRLGVQENTELSQDVVLYGFGRIGRLLARELISGLSRGSSLRLRAIVTRDPLDKLHLLKRASLWNKDSIHGAFKADIRLSGDDTHLIVNGIPIAMIQAQKPEDINYEDYGIHQALIIDNTGAFRDKTQLQRHLKCPGAQAVLLTAPGKDIDNIVMGVNQQSFNPEQQLNPILSAASCTTNAIAPVLALVDQHYGINQGHIETIHAYTNDQNLVDNMHKKNRRGRAAGLNMVITETGAGKAVAKALPRLAGKLSSNAIRVPIPDGSLAILHLQLEHKTSLGELKNMLHQESISGRLKNQIHYSEDPDLVSSDIIGSTAASIVDSQACQLSEDGKNAVIYLWYDNEYGYSHQVLRLAEYMQAPQLELRQAALKNNPSPEQQQSL